MSMHTYDTVVSMSQVGSDGLMRMHSLVGIMQDCSMQWLRTEPIMREWMLADDIIMVLTSRQVDIVRYPSMGEKLQVRTSVFGYKSYLGYRNTCVYDEAGEAVANCWCMGAWYGHKAGKAIKIPDHVLESLLVEDEVSMEKLPRKIKMPKDDPAAVNKLVARRSDTDRFGHVNNAQYVRMLWDSLPEDVAPRRLRVEYKAQAKQDETIVIKRWESEGKVLASMESEEGEVFSTLEFTL